MDGPSCIFIMWQERNETNLRRPQYGMEGHEAAGVDCVLREAGLGVGQPRQPQAVPVRRLPRHRANLPRVVLDEPPERNLLILTPESSRAILFSISLGETSGYRIDFGLVASQSVIDLRVREFTADHCWWIVGGCVFPMRVIAYRTFV